MDLWGKKRVFRRAGADVATGFAEAPAQTIDAPTESPQLFGWLKGMVTTAPGVDLAGPADPDWGGGTEDEREPAA